MKRSVVVGALGTAQTLAWASSYYLPAILADPIAHGLGLSRTTVFGLFSGALLLSAVLGPAVGRAIDNRGGRGVLALSNLVLAAGLVLLGVAQGFVTLALAWVALGVGMAMGLYDPAFATLTGLYGRAARGPITGITLIAGFASTVGWPLSAFLDAQFGWRAACLILAALHLVIGLPLNRLLRSEYALYALLLTQPILGLLHTNAHGDRVNLFFEGQLPALIGQDRPLAKQLLAAHKTVGLLLLGLIALHALAALYHHFWRRDDTLRAMGFSQNRPR